MHNNIKIVILCVLVPALFLVIKLNYIWTTWQIYRVQATPPPPPPSRWEVSSHALQCQRQFVVFENRQMSNGTHNNYLRTSEVGDSSMFTDSVDQCHYVNSLYTLENVSTNGVNDTLISYKEVSSCKEIRLKLLQLLFSVLKL